VVLHNLGGAPGKNVLGVSTTRGEGARVGWSWVLLTLINWGGGHFVLLLEPWALKCKKKLYKWNPFLKWVKGSLNLYEKKSGSALEGRS